MLHALRRCWKVCVRCRPRRKSEWFVRLRLRVPGSSAGVPGSSVPDAGHLIAQFPPEDKRRWPYTTLQCHCLAPLTLGMRGPNTYRGVALSPMVGSPHATAQDL